MKKLLLITYYWPPAGGGGVQRWLKMSKYLKSFGWQPIIYTAEPKEYVAYDQSLVKEVPSEIVVLRQPIWEPYQIYRFFTGQKSSDGNYSGFIQQKSKPSLSQKISLYLRSNLFIPDARKFWIKPSIRFLKKWLENNKVDAIISTGPPHSMHLIALGIKQYFPYIPWISDFRDPWTNIDYYDKLKLTKASDFKHKRLEKNVLTLADQVVTVSWTWADELNSIADRSDVATITNGYDPADFSKEKNKLDNHFSIVHIGSMNPDRNPVVLWSAIRQLIQKDPSIAHKISIELIGFVDRSIMDSVHEFGLHKLVSHKPFIEHMRIVKRIASARLLLLPINTSKNNKGIIPGKLYEYMASRRPILGIGPHESDVYKIFKEHKIGSFYNYEDQQGVLGYLEKQYTIYANNISGSVTSDVSIDRFSRAYLAKEYAKLLDNVIGKNPTTA